MKVRGSRALGSQGRTGIIPLIGVALFLIGWWAVASMGLVSALILPSPVRVLLAAKDVGWPLGGHAAVTTGRILAGLLLGVALGGSLGLLMQYSRRAYLWLDGIIESMRPVPPVATVPFFILIFGFSEMGKLLLVTLGTGLVAVVATIEAIERVDVSLVRWGLVCGLSRKELFWKIIVPASLPEMRAGVRIAHATAVALVVVSEFMGARYGLGYLINVSKVTLTTPTIILSIIMLGWVNWILDLAIRSIFDKVCFWDVRAKGATL